MVRDDALAPVVAMMLILAVVVTLFSLWNSVYLPGLKQQAEVEHLSQVETGMMEISSAIDQAAYARRDGRLTVPIPLGGGDIMFNNVRSGGVLRIHQSGDPVMKITIDGDSSYSAYLSNITYTPVSNFWVPQGYSWQYGYLNVTKGDLNTTLMLEDQKVNSERSFGKNLRIDCQESGDYVDIIFVNITPGVPDMMSGNAIAQLTLNATRTRLKDDLSGSSIIVTFDESGTHPDNIIASLYNATNSTFNRTRTLQFEGGDESSLSYKILDGTTLECLEIELSVE